MDEQKKPTPPSSREEFPDIKEFVNKFSGKLGTLNSICELMDEIFHDIKLAEANLDEKFIEIESTAREFTSCRNTQCRNLIQSITSLHQLFHYVRLHRQRFYQIREQGNRFIDNVKESPQ